jgi:purine-nucleoside phosphorylase
VYSARLRALARAVSPDLREGVYAMLPGPQYQTLAETRMLRTFGADVVGMSTVLEAVAAREAGMELLGLSVVTTREGTGEVIDPEEVVAVASASASKLGHVVADVIERWAHRDVQ